MLAAKSVPRKSSQTLAAWLARKTAAWPAELPPPTRATSCGAELAEPAHARDLRRLKDQKYLVSPRLDDRWRRPRHDARNPFVALPRSLHRGRARFSGAVIGTHS